MNLLKIRLKRNAMRNIVEMKSIINASILPFKELPSVDQTIEDIDHLNAHDLFSLYTADIIKKEIIFVR